MNLLEVVKRKAQQTKFDKSHEQEELWKHNLLQRLKELLAYTWENVKVFNLHSSNELFDGQVQTDFKLEPQLLSQLVGNIEINGQNAICFHSEIDLNNRQIKLTISSTKGLTVYDPFLEYDVLKRDFEKVINTIDEVDQVLIEMAEYLSIYCK